MKNIIATLVLFVSIVLSIGAIKPVFAQTPAADNAIVKIYDDGRALTSAGVGNESTNNLQQTVIGKTSSIFSLDQLVNGSSSIAEGPVKEKFLAEHPDLRYGIAQKSTAMMTNAFLYGPSTNIPGYYAQMLLPKQLLESGGTAYAAWSTPPETGSSLGYMKDMGLNKLWGITFTLAMSMFVVILIIAGFMIMFRSKAGGQVVVTISMALQNAVIGAVLALASYALGAFFLNLSKYLVMVLAVLFEGVYQQNGGGIPVIYINGPWKLFTDFAFTTVWGSPFSQHGFFGQASTWWQSAQQGIIGQAVSNGSSGQNGAIPDLLDKVWVILRVPVELEGFTIINVIAKIVISGALCITAIRIFWTVLSTYIKMIIDIVMAPIIFMVSSLPGKQIGFTTWIKRMFNNAIAIPLMFAFVNVAAFMAYNVAAAGSGCTGAGKSILTCITGGMIPGGSTGGTDWLLLAVGPSSIVALVILNLVPSVPAMVAEMFPQPKGGGDFSKAWEGTKKSLQTMPGIGGLFQ